MVPWSFSRREGPWPRQELTPAGRRSLFQSNSQLMENQLELLGVFRWYREQSAPRADPRRKRKGEPHPFGMVPLDLTAAEWRKFKRAFPDLLYLPRKSFRLPKRVRVAGSPDAVGSLAQADLWHRADVGILPSLKLLGKGVKIAVVDSGIAAGHDEFSDKVIRAVDIDPKTGAFLPGTQTDTHGHGTHVASLIAGRNIGIAPAAKLVDVRVLPDGAARPEALVAALSWIAQFATDVQIVNLSATFDTDISFEPVVNQLLQLNMLFVCASGNTPLAGSPADYEAVLTVGASTRDRKVWPDSGSKFQAAPPLSVPDLIAPGVEIWGARAAGGYETRTGTSQATAIVSGLAALEIQLRAPQGKVMADQVMASLKDRTDALPDEAVRAGRGIAHL